jgi:phage gpG-like protein
VGVKDLQHLAPHVKENFEHWGHEGHKKRENGSHGKEMQKNTGVADSFKVLHSNRWGVPVETRWCVGAVHQIYLVLNYLIIQVT